MDTLTPKLTYQQLTQNIDAMKGQLPDDQIQDYVDNYQGDGQGGYVLKSSAAPADAPAPVPQPSAAASPSSASPFADQTVFGNAPGGNFLQNIAQSTIGYNGLGGDFGRPIVSAMISGATAPLAQSKDTLAQVTQALVRKVQTMDPSDPQYGVLSQQIGDNLKVMGKTDDELNVLSNNQESQEQNVGNALNSAATLGSFAASPIAAAAKGAAAAAGRIGIGAGYGAAVGAAGQMEGNAAAPQVALGSGIGAVTGGALSAAGEFASKLFGSLADTGPTAKLNKISTLTTLQNALADAKTDPIETISTMMRQSKTPLLSVSQGKIVTEGLDDALQGARQDINKEADQVVEGIPGEVNLGKFQEDIEDAIRTNKTIRGSGEAESALATVEKKVSSWVKSYGPKAAEGEPEATAADVNVPYSVINEIRQAMNARYNPDTVDVERAIGNMARKYLYDADTGSPALQKLMQQDTAYAEAQGFARKLAGKAVNGGQLGQMFARMTGAGIGSMAGFFGGGPLAGAAMGAFGEEVAGRGMAALQGNYFKPSLFSSPASTLSRFIATPAAQSAGSIADQAISRGTGNLLFPSPATGSQSGQ